MIGFVQQSVKMWKTKSGKDVSGLTLVQLSMGVSLWMFSGIHLNDFMIIGANAVSLSTLWMVLGLYITLNRRNHDP
jgi:uncharacterized protein with PQ loop repeat